MGEEEYGATLPYGIMPGPVYYMCLNCGNVMSKDQIDQLPSIMCSRCGYRIFVRLRSTRPDRVRKVYAV